VSLRSQGRKTRVEVEPSLHNHMGHADLRGTQFSARVAAPTASTIEVRLDSPTGRLLGTASVPATGDPYRYATATAALARARGHHDVYLVFGGALRVSTFSIR